MAENTQHPAPDLATTLKPGSHWVKHLNDPDVTYASNDITHIKEVLREDTAHFKSLSTLYHSGLARARDAEANAEYYRLKYEEAIRAKAPKGRSRLHSAIRVRAR